MDKKDKDKASNKDTQRAGLDQIESIPTSRMSRMFRTGWAARKAVPLALKRTVELVSAEKGDRKEAAEKILAEQEAYAEELFRTLGTMKGLAQKIGQVVSYMEGVLPPELAPIYQRVLARLQDSAPALPPMVSQSVIEEELDCLIEDHFDEFDEEPFAAASIGQVHRGRLHDGTEVAIKVQYPDVDRAFISDLKNLKVIETLFSPLISYYKGKDIIELTRQQLLDELDYVKERKNHQQFRSFFQDHPSIHIPKVFPELSTGKLLVTEFVDGMSFHEVCEEDETLRNRVAQNLFLFYWRSIFIHRFVNGDPHPGNYIFHKDGRISCLDFGAAIPVQPSFAQQFQTNITAYIHQDDETFRATLAGTYGVPDDDEIVFSAYASAIHAFLEPFHPEKQPFQFSTEWMEQYFEQAASQAKQILLRGGKIPKLPPPAVIPTDLPLMQRVGMGLSSLITPLKGSGHWDSLAMEVFVQTT